jgi:uncharacterized cupin superfamily protein
MKTLIFLSGGGVVLSAEVAPVEFQAGDCLIIPAAFQGAAKFSDETQYLRVSL